MWWVVRRLLSLTTLFVLLGAYVVVSASAIAFLKPGDVLTLILFVTLVFAVVAAGVLGAYVTWIRKEVADLNSPPPGWERSDVPNDDRSATDLSAVDVPDVDLPDADVPDADVPDVDLPDADRRDADED
jgi:hypothetical protein